MLHVEYKSRSSIYAAGAVRSKLSARVSNSASLTEALSRSLSLRWVQLTSHSYTYVAHSSSSTADALLYIYALPLNSFLLSLSLYILIYLVLYMRLIYTNNKDASIISYPRARDTLPLLVSVFSLSLSSGELYKSWIIHYIMIYI